MHRIAIASRLIQEIAYDPDSRHLDVLFHDGVVRHLADVPSEVVSGLLTAASPGRYYMDFIRKTYPRRGETVATAEAARA